MSFICRKHGVSRSRRWLQQSSDFSTTGAFECRHTSPCQETVWGQTIEIDENFDAEQLRSERGHFPLSYVRCVSCRQPPVRLPSVSELWADHIRRVHPEQLVHVYLTNEGLIYCQHCEQTVPAVAPIIAHISSVQHKKWTKCFKDDEKKEEYTQAGPLPPYDPENPYSAPAPNDAGATLARPLWMQHLSSQHDATTAYDRQFQLLENCTWKEAKVKLELWQLEANGELDRQHQEGEKTSAEIAEEERQREEAVKASTFTPPAKPFTVSARKVMVEDAKRVIYSPDVSTVSDVEEIPVKRKRREENKERKQNPSAVMTTTRSTTQSSSVAVAATGGKAFYPGQQFAPMFMTMTAEMTRRESDVSDHEGFFTTKKGRKKAVVPASKRVASHSYTSPIVNPVRSQNPAPTMTFLREGEKPPSEKPSMSQQRERETVSRDRDSPGVKRRSSRSRSREKRHDHHHRSKSRDRYDGHHHRSRHHDTDRDRRSLSPRRRVNSIEKDKGGVVCHTHGKMRGRRNMEKTADGHYVCKVGSECMTRDSSSISNRILKRKRSRSVSEDRDHHCEREKRRALSPANTSSANNLFHPCVRQYGKCREEERRGASSCRWAFVPSNTCMQWLVNGEREIPSHDQETCSWLHRFEIHPCLQEYGSCKFGASCSFLYLPADLCIRWLRGKPCKPPPGKTCNAKHEYNGSTHHPPFGYKPPGTGTIESSSPAAVSSNPVTPLKSSFFQDSRLQPQSPSSTTFASPLVVAPPSATFNLEAILDKGEDMIHQSQQCWTASIGTSDQLERDYRRDGVPEDMLRPLPVLRKAMDAMFKNAFQLTQALQSRRRGLRYVAAQLKGIRQDLSVHTSHFQHRPWISESHTRLNEDLLVAELEGLLRSIQIDACEATIICSLELRELGELTQSHVKLQPCYAIKYEAEEEEIGLVKRTSFEATSNATKIIGMESLAVSVRFIQVALQDANSLDFEIMSLPAQEFQLIRDVGLTFELCEVIANTQPFAQVVQVIEKLQNEAVMALGKLLGTNPSSSCICEPNDAESCRYFYKYKLAIYSWQLLSMFLSKLRIKALYELCRSAKHSISPRQIERFLGFDRIWPEFSTSLENSMGKLLEAAEFSFHEEIKILKLKKVRGTVSLPIHPVAFFMEVPSENLSTWCPTPATQLDKFVKEHFQFSILSSTTTDTSDPSSPSYDAYHIVVSELLQKITVYIQNLSNAGK